MVFALLGMLPDFDFLFDAHRGPTHSVTAAVTVALVAAFVARSRPRLWVASGAAYGSHVLLDWLGTDTVAPFGLMALWPFDGGHYQLATPVFLPVCREYWLVDCWVSLTRTVGLELLLLVPLTAAALGLVPWGRRRLAKRDSRRQPSA